MLNRSISFHQHPENPRFIDRSGWRFGRLVAIGYMGGGRSGKWLYRCDCGREKVVHNSLVSSAHYPSCGCRNALWASVKRSARAAFSTTNRPLYGTWYGMIDRCHNPECEGYAGYGGRGISVCDRWRYSFLNFESDMPNKPSPFHSIDRIDNYGNYEPGNVRWATSSEQSYNKRSNHKVEIDGESKIITEWAKQSGVSRILICNRLRAGWSNHAAVFTPSDKAKSRNHAERRPKNHSGKRGDLQVYGSVLHHPEHCLPCGSRRGFVPRNMCMQAF